MADSNIACPACLSISSKIYIDGVTDLFHGMSGTWNLLECAGCGLIYVSPLIPENHISDYYPKDYSAFVAGNDVSVHPLSRSLRSLATLPYTLKFGQPGYFPSHFGNARLLDVGCGAGRYLQQMSSLGWQCTGLDISEAAIAAAKISNPEARFFVSTLGEVELGDKFDLIVMHHVLEHLYHPQKILDICNKLLLPGGKLVVSVPNIASWEARVFGRRWAGLDIPRHVLHFKELVLERLLLDAGFSIEKKRTGMFASSISESFIMCLPAMLRGRIIQSRLGRIFYLMLVPIACVSYFLGNRGTVEIVALKN